MLNSLPVGAAARQPRGLIQINGTTVPGWVEWEVDNNTFYQADTFRVTFAASYLPAAFGLPFWAGTVESYVEIFAGFPADPDNFSTTDLESLIYGRIDDVTYNPSAGVIVVSGRDLTAAFIEAQTMEKWPNKTASDIATTLAQRHGLTPIVTPTKVKAGRYYDIDHVRLTDQRSEWDMLTWLAHEEQFSVYVKGRELHFEPKPSPASNAYVIQWQGPAPGDDFASPSSNATRLLFSRNLTLARDITVKVRSWNDKQQAGFTVQAKATKAKNKTINAANFASAISPFGSAQVFSYTIPNLSKDEALKRAYAILADLSRHEVTLEADMPADNILQTTSLIQVQGTGAAFTQGFDMDFYPASIRRSMSMSAGYRMDIHAKNHSPETVTQA